MKDEFKQARELLDRKIREKRKLPSYTVEDHLLYLREQAEKPKVK